MILLRHQTATGEWIFIWNDGGFPRQLRTHQENDECRELGCVLHNPSDTIQNRECWPYNWRTDRGIMERICEHGCGHPDYDSAQFLSRQGKEYENVHGCDFCGDT